MVEFDFDTKEGRDKAKSYVKEIVENDKKEEIAELLFAMLEFTVKHEVNFENIKGVL